MKGSSVVEIARARGEDVVNRLDVALRYYETPESPCILTTYGELYDAAKRAGGVLRTSASSRAGCCGVMLEDGPFVFVCQLASMMAGMPVIPLNPHDPITRLRSVFDDADIQAVIVADAASAAIVSQVCEDAKVWIVNELMDAPSVANDEIVAPAGDDTSHIFFTSGSTGRPKGCVASHKALLAYCEAKNSAHEISDKDVVFCASSHMFDPHFTDFCSALVAGATLVSASRETTFTRFGDILYESKATHCLTTPVVLGTVEDMDKVSASSVRLVALGGEAMSKAIAHRWIDAGVRVANTYGVTECVAYQTFREVKDPNADDVRSLGDPLPGNVLVFAREPGDDPTALAASGELAELWIGGSQVGTGYLNRPELTASRFKNGMYRTGDIVRVGDNGEAVLVGRRDDQVKISGQRVELGEIEEAIRQTCVPLAGEVKCVLSKTKQLIAYCVGDSAKNDLPIYNEVMKLAVSKDVPRHMVPFAFVFLETLPMTSTGKVSRSALCKMEVGSIASSSTSPIEFGAFGIDLAKVWSEELGVSVENGDDDFILMGGDSLAALRVVKRVKSLLNDSKEDEAGAFGEALGIFGPIELLQRTRLNDYARFVRQSVSGWPSKYEETDDAESAPSRANIALRAVLTGDGDLLRVLHVCGVDLNPRDGIAPLHIACANAHIDCVRALLELGCAANAVGNHRKTPVLLAASSGACTVEMLNTLIESGAKIDVVDADKQTVIHAAARAGASSAVLRALLLNCAQNTSAKKAPRSSSLNVNALDAWGRTPLHWASVNGHRNACKALLDLGVDASIKDDAGETARAIAERRALCSAQERPKGGRPSTWGDIANLLGGSGATKHLKKTLA